MLKNTGMNVSHHSFNAKTITTLLNIDDLLCNFISTKVLESLAHKHISEAIVEEKLDWMLR